MYIPEYTRNYPQISQNCPKYPKHIPELLYECRQLRVDQGARAGAALGRTAAHHPGAHGGAKFPQWFQCESTSHVLNWVNRCLE